MSDHNERACQWCGSLLHHENECKTFKREQRKIAKWNKRIKLRKLEAQAESGKRWEEDCHQILSALGITATPENCDNVADAAVEKIENLKSRLEEARWIIGHAPNYGSGDYLCRRAAWQNWPKGQPKGE